VWLALLLAPAGAMLRAELGRYNPVCPPLPLCTLLANLLGCAVAALCTVGCSTLRSTHFGGESRSFVCSVDPRNAVDGVAGHALQIELAVALSAVGAGFAGSLSTTSTFVAEVLAERPAVGAAYAAASIGAAQLLLLAVNLPWRLSG
jgi:fluoride ion exporter CrcB/FEX